MKKLLIILIPIMIGCENADHTPDIKSEDYQFIVAMAKQDTNINCNNPIVYKGDYEYIVNERGDVIARYLVSYNSTLLIMVIFFFLVGVLAGVFLNEIYN